MKKFLSLVLALIMTMSLVTISAGATEYRDLTDKDEIQYEEAVAVLNRIGVITGYEDGSFRPETELTRGAAAKIIVSLMIGPDAASALPNNASPYPDVPAGHTFAGVIGYCKTAGYISGYGDGTFKPANPLTGFAFAKMLLGAVGYKANIEGFVDTGWTMNVARIGNVAGLFDRISFDGAKAVTRDEACQLALNTLKATMVDYGSANTVVSSSGEVLTVQGSKAQYVTSNNREINANINRRVISAQNNEMTLEFGEEHFKDLRLEHDRFDPAYDIYGHPSNEWSYKKVTIGTFPLPADFTFTKQMAHLEDTVATKEKALGLRGYDTYSTDHSQNYSNWSTPGTSQYNTNSPFADATQIHINGWNARVRNSAYTQTPVPTGETAGQGNWYTYDAHRIDSSTKDQAPSLSEICDLTDNGVTVEVYVCPVDADFITDVVVTRTQLMEVDRIASDYVELDVLDSDSDDPRDDSKLTEIAGYNDYALASKVVSVKDDNYDAYNVLKDLKAGDEVAVIPYTADDGDTWEVGRAYVPETVSGALTNVDIYNTRSKADGNAIAITVGGTTYPIAQWNVDMREISGTKIRATKKDVTLLLDEMGNALMAKDIGSSDDWIVVGDYYQATLTSGRVGWYVHGWTIKGDEVDLELGTIRGAAEKYAPGELVRYRVAEEGNGEYELVKPMYRTEGSLYADGYRAAKNGRQTSWVEPEGDKDGDDQTGQGVYNIAQYALQGGSAGKYAISSRNTLVPLEFYDSDRRTEENAYTAAGRHLRYSEANSNTPVTENSTVINTSHSDFFYAANAANAQNWTYRTAPYDGVKFIFVGFDEANGEVDTINVLDGAQNVPYTELIQINRWWKNVGTNGDDFVASPAEAYVDKNGRVKAVVIKSDSAEANLKDLMIITDNRGANTSTKSVGAEAPTSGTYYTRQYVSGEDGFKEEKTGYFDRALSVGTVVTGRLDSNNIFTTRVFHSSAYTNRNPDGFYVKGIGALRTNEDKRSDYAFYVGTTNGVGAIQYLSTGVGGGKKIPVNDAEILTDKSVLGVDTGYAKNGLITVDSTTQFIDLRDGRPGDIDELKDLFDKEKCNPDTVELKVLVNGNSSSDGFRHAYAIMVLWTSTGTGGATSSERMYYTVRMNLSGDIQTVVRSVTKDEFTNNQTAPIVAGYSPRISTYNLSTLGFTFKANTETNAADNVVNLYYDPATVTAVNGPEKGTVKKGSESTLEDAVDKVEPGVYTITENFSTDAMKVNEDTDLSDCRVFKYVRPVAGKYRLVIDNMTTYWEDAAGMSAGQGKWVVQVTNYMDGYFGNAGTTGTNGTLAGAAPTALKDGTHTYYIYLVKGSGESETTELVQSGNFKVTAPTPVNGTVSVGETPAAPQVNLGGTIDNKLSDASGDKTKGQPLTSTEAQEVLKQILNNEPGVYTPEDYHIGKENNTGAEISSPLNMGNGTVNPAACRLFTWESSKSGIVTLTIDGGRAYKESSSTERTGSGLFNVQVVKSGDAFYNSGTEGTMGHQDGGSQPLSAGTHTYKITQATDEGTIILIAGEFKVGGSVAAYNTSTDGWAKPAASEGGGGTSSGGSDGGASSGTPATPSGDEPVSDEGVTPVESAPVDEEPNAEDVGEETPAPAPEVEEPTGDVDSIA